MSPRLPLCVAALGLAVLAGSGCTNGRLTVRTRIYQPEVRAASLAHDPQATPEEKTFAWELARSVERHQQPAFAGDPLAELWRLKVVGGILEREAKAWNAIMREELMRRADAAGQALAVDLADMETLLFHWKETRERLGSALEKYQKDPIPAETEAKKQWNGGIARTVVDIAGSLAADAAVFDRLYDAGVAVRARWPVHPAADDRLAAYSLAAARHADQRLAARAEELLRGPRLRIRDFGRDGVARPETISELSADPLLALALADPGGWNEVRIEPRNAGQLALRRGGSPHDGPAGIEVAADGKCEFVLVREPNQSFSLHSLHNDPTQVLRARAQMANSALQMLGQITRLMVLGGIPIPSLPGAPATAPLLANPDPAAPAPQPAAGESTTRERLRAIAEQRIKEIDEALKLAPRGDARIMALDPGVPAWRARAKALLDHPEVAHE